MEDRYQHTVNGQSVLQADLNAMAETASLADDRVFAEILRMAPYNGSSPSRGILPYTSANAATVAPNGASGSVLVNPFRAFVGPRTAVATDPKKNWRDVRSAIALGSTTLAQSVALAANSSGNPRWDLVYAAVAIDVNAPTVTRKVKDPTTKVIASQNVVNTVRTTVTVTSLAGTPSATPVWPAAPSDAGGVYYIPLAYVRVPNGFGASSTVLPGDIATIAPILRLSRATGGNSFQVADQHYNATTAQQQSWGASGTRPKVWMPPDMSGKEELLFVLDLRDPSSANWSHQNNGLVDSRDWRGRVVRSTVYVPDLSATNPELAWMQSSLGFPRVFDIGAVAPVASPSEPKARVSVGMANTINESTVGSNKADVAYVHYNYFLDVDAGSTAIVKPYCDLADSGKLKVSIVGTPLALIFVWLEFTGPFTNK